MFSGKWKGEFNSTYYPNYFWFFPLVKGTIEFDSENNYVLVNYFGIYNYGVSIPFDLSITDNQIKIKHNYQEIVFTITKKEHNLIYGTYSSRYPTDYGTVLFKPVVS